MGRDAATSGPGTGKAGFPNAPATLPVSPLSIQLRWEQCCESPGCTKPARYGDLCTACFLAATPARRAAELSADRRGPREIAPAGESVVDREGAAWLWDLWAA